MVTQARQFAGCLDFALSPDRLDSGRVNVYECWDSAARLHLFRGFGPDEAQQVAITDADVRDYPAAAWHGRDARREEAHREVMASLAPSATNEPAKTRRIQVITRGRETMWFLTAAANTP